MIKDKYYNLYFKERKEEKGQKEEKKEKIPPQKKNFKIFAWSNKCFS